MRGPPFCDKTDKTHNSGKAKAQGKKKEEEKEKRGCGWLGVGVQRSSGSAQCLAFTFVSRRVSVSDCSVVPSCLDKYLYIIPSSKTPANLFSAQESKSTFCYYWFHAVQHCKLHADPWILTNDNGSNKQARRLDTCVKVLPPHGQLLVSSKRDGK